MSPAARVSPEVRRAMFAPLGDRSRAAGVVRRLTDAIALGLLHDAERLPSEAELADRFGVAPVTVREALVSLRQQGLVETRRGRAGGSFVRAPDDPAVSVLRSRLRGLGLGDVRDLCDHYAAVAGSAARLAAERAGDEDVERLRAVVAEHARTGGVAAHRRAEGLFHVELAAAAQSARLTREELRLQADVGPLLWLAPLDDATRRASVQDHQRIASAVARGTGTRARSLVEQHVASAFDRVAKVHRELARSAT